MIRRVFASALGLAACLCLASGRCEAGLLLRIEPTTATAGGSGAFDVILEAVGRDYEVSGFSFGLEAAAGSGVAFAGATDATGSIAYIFAGEGGFDFTAPSTSTLVANESLMSAPSVTLRGGDSVGLGRVSFTVAAGATAGDVALTFLLGGETLIFDDQGGFLDFDPMAGIITIAAPNAVPEPASLVLLGLAVAPLVAGSRRRAG